MTGAADLLSIVLAVAAISLWFAGVFALTRMPASSCADVYHPQFVRGVRLLGLAVGLAIIALGLSIVAWGSTAP
ncbi:hypothetical protein K9B35_14380 [Sphingomonas sp. R647]|uniref:hypothetical protein n=1 Tax=Sphingomonas sp. R647 TaxID=2875233 RepID=UPI001CD19B7E|nr:hypothetical protein [Sphingomonas sp. R647]MCA1199161.1 hypothetical protein [Sphingomonas sp. R647]